jgi:hypothetical protein
MKLLQTIKTPQKLKVVLVRFIRLKQQGTFSDAWRRQPPNLRNMVFQTISAVQNASLRGSEAQKE